MPPSTINIRYEGPPASYGQRVATVHPAQLARSTTTCVQETHRLAVLPQTLWLRRQAARPAKEIDARLLGASSSGRPALDPIGANHGPYKAAQAAKRSTFASDQLMGGRPMRAAAKKRALTAAAKRGDESWRPPGVGQEAQVMLAWLRDGARQDGRLWASP